MVKGSSKMSSKGYLIKRKFLYFLYLLSLTLLFLEIQYLNLNHSFHWDLTKEKRNTLTERTKAILKKINKPLEILILIPKSHPLFSQVKDLVEEMQNLQPRIHIQILDILRNPDQLDKFRKSYQQLGRETGLILSMGGKKKYFSMFDLQSQKTFFKGEEVILSGINSLLKKEKEKIYFVTGHGEPSISSFEPEGIGQLAKYLEVNGYQVQSLSLKEKGFPYKAPLIVIIGPKREIPLEEELLLRRYLRKGGSLLIFLDPESPLLLERTLEESKILLPHTQVIEPEQHILRDPKYIAVQNFGSHPLAEDFRGFTLYLPGARPILATQRVQVLLQSSAQSRLSPPVPKASSKGPYPLGVFIQKKGTLVLLGDSHFLRNGIFQGNRPLWGLSLGVNQDFAFSLISHLAEKNILLGLGRKPLRNPNLQLNSSEMTRVWWFTCIFLPSIILLMGTSIWLWRKS